MDAHAKMVSRCRDMIRQLNLYLNHFPKHEKYGLCQHMRNAAYDIYALIVECNKRYHKKTALANLDIRHEQLRMFVHLAFELGYFGYRDSRADNAPERLGQNRLTTLSAIIDDVGRMIGGWIRGEKFGQ